MVVLTKEQARAEFAKNLQDECNLHGAPIRARPAWLRKKINNAVSRESCRKWLAGEDMPDQANLSVLIKALGANEQKLRIGEWSPPPGAHDERLRKLTQSWPKLSSKAQDAIMAVLDAIPSEGEAESPQLKPMMRRRGHGRV